MDECTIMFIVTRHLKEKIKTRSNTISERSGEITQQVKQKVPRHKKLHYVPRKESVQQLPWNNEQLCLS